MGEERRSEEVNWVLRMATRDASREGSWEGEEASESRKARMAFESSLSFEDEPELLDRGLLEEGW
jgi:hypothetical protein